MSEDRPPSELIKSPTAADWLRDKIVSVDYDAANAGGPNRISVAPVNATRYLHLQFANIYVRDQERSMRFFVDRLGFTLVRDVRFASATGSYRLRLPTGPRALRWFCRGPNSGKKVWLVTAHR